MSASSAFIRDYVEILGWKAEDDSASFDATLKAARRARFAETIKGKVLIGFTSGGTQSTYSLPSIGSYTAQDVSEAGEKIARAAEAIRAEDDDITDAALVAALVARFQPIRAVSLDYRGLAAGGGY